MAKQEQRIVSQKFHAASKTSFDEVGPRIKEMGGMEEARKMQVKNHLVSDDGSMIIGGMLFVGREQG